MVAEHYSTVGVGCRLSIVREATCVCMCVWDRDAGNIQGLSGLSTQFCHEPKTALIGKVYFSSVQFSSVAQSCPTLSNPMNRSTPGLPVHHQLPECTQTHVHWVDDAIQSSSIVPFSSCPQSFPASGSFQIDQFFTSGGQNIGVS